LTRAARAQAGGHDGPGAGAGKSAEGPIAAAERALRELRAGQVAEADRIDAKRHR
jgi:hypothetical protein